MENLSTLNVTIQQYFISLSDIQSEEKASFIEQIFNKTGWAIIVGRENICLKCIMINDEGT